MFGEFFCSQILIFHCSCLAFFGNKWLLLRAQADINGIAIMAKRSGAGGDPTLRPAEGTIARQSGWEQRWSRGPVFS